MLGSKKAKSGHVVLNRLANGAIGSIADALLEKQSFRDNQHALDYFAALICAFDAVEKFAAVLEVAAHGVVAL